jgi:glycosyltransferase involved in cell wall biosynthesis
MCESRDGNLQTAVPILWVCRQPTPYNNYLFEQLTRHFRLHVRFLDRMLASHPWTVGIRPNCSHDFNRPGRPIDLDLLKMARSGFVVIAGWGDLTCITLIILLGVFNRPFALLTDTPRQVRGRGLRDRLRSAFLVWAFGKAKYVLGTGSIALQRLEGMGAHPSKLLSFPFVVDQQRFIPTTAGTRRRNNRWVFLSSGRLEAMKDHLTAIKALALVRRICPDQQYIYRIAGAGSLRSTIEQAAARQSVQLEFVGWLNPDELPGFYSSGDALLHPSTYDPYPNAVLEAMACGLPVIVSAAIGLVGDRLVEGINALVHAPGDHRSLARHLMSFLSDAGIREGLRRGSLAASRSWTIDDAVQTVRGLVNLPAAPPHPLF